MIFLSAVRAVAVLSAIAVVMRIATPGVVSGVIGGWAGPSVVMAAIIGPWRLVPVVTAIVRTRRRPIHVAMVHISPIHVSMIHIA